MDLNTAGLQFVISLSTILGAVLVIARFLKPIWAKFKTFTESWDLFMRDWSGEPARPGHDAEPGVMERLNNLDGQFKNNGGSSMRDSLDRIEGKMSSIDKRLAEGEVRFEHIEKELGKNG